ncbi:4-coumarate--CoA ligase 1-like [Drosophila rhopaloa]|uniref:4-coumarate--CoA ligase 1-like n=1 Tax=Drosophila rhopaloa TaxID=1041015 RepID=A0A6P4F7B9_DRORH|nr:4-coumarate--CoA ligase 1-like [Drosophila rhopaloa]XP_016981264.1 4-coumarate--CoA ligase 1-like [Drosophila rhopaloa]XP_016981265.1 4-coumarate--CoA ligase 1-like [Drosophila rhopaloa]XP_016981266.1 4-coumarate--CoA ligase 1-like [Drosophila rhopaloa]
MELSTTYDARLRVWSGAERIPTYTDEKSLGKIICNVMRTWPKNVCQIDDVDGTKVTFEQAISWAIRMAQIFKKKGLRHLDVIGIAARNSTYVMPVGVACLLNTTPFHAVNPVADEATLTHVFSITKPTIIFCDGKEYEKVRAATKGWQPEIFTVTDPVEGVPHVDSLLQSTKTEMFYQPEPLKEGGDQTAAIQCSSGTTGLPKAVCISNRTLLREFFTMTSEWIIYSASGLDWHGGLISFLKSTVDGSTRIIANTPFAPDYFVKLVERYKINCVLLPHCQLSALINFPGVTKTALASIRRVFYGGGFTSMTTLKKMQELCPTAILISVYAMTEVRGVSINIGLRNGTTVGKPMTGVKIRIVDEEGNNQGYNEVGEIYVHTGLPWKGYYGNPEESQRTLDHEGWFHTGDLGYFDEQNLLYVVDRKKEILKYQGNHYWPSEIEGVIAELPQVEEVCVIGIYDEQQGDAAGALVVKSKGSSITEKDISDHVAKRLPSVQKQLHAGVQFTDKLPTNPNGKTLRRIARLEFVAKKEAGK